MSVALPLLLHGKLVFDTQIPAESVNFGIGASVAIAAGCYFMRRIGSFPGVQSGAHIVPAVSAPFALVLAGLVFLQLEYSRFLLVSSYLFALVWFIGMHLATRAVPRSEFAVVPGGHADRLITGHAGLRWRKLQTPSETLEGVSGVIADLRQDFSARWEHFLADCTVRGIPVFHSKQMQELLTGKVDVEHPCESGFGSLLPSLAYVKIKQIVDWVAALLFLPPFIVIVVLVAPLIMLETGRPVFFCQQRVGYRGKTFRVWKFRTMKTVDPVTGDGQDREAAITVDGDTRITALGRFLRRYRIDELPQVFNILKGEMSWIGPRPEAIALSRWYEDTLPFYRYRHVVRPGITGWAQVNQGHVALPGEVRDKLRYDFFYIKHFSPWLDVVIAMRTVATVLAGFGAK